MTKVEEKKEIKPEDKEVKPEEIKETKHKDEKDEIPIEEELIQYIYQRRTRFMILGSGKLFDKKDKPKKGENIRYDDEEEVHEPEEEEKKLEDIKDKKPDEKKEKREDKEKILKKEKTIRNYKAKRKRNN